MSNHNLEFTALCYLILWYGNWLVTSCSCVRTVATIFSHEGKSDVWRTRNEASVSPWSGRWYSASQRASTRMMQFSLGIFPIRRRLLRGSRTPLANAKSGSAMHSLIDTAPYVYKKQIWCFTCQWSILHLSSLMVKKQNENRMLRNASLIHIVCY